MSHLPSRKTFFAKLLGLVAVAGVAPQLVAQAAKPVPSTTPVPVRPDPRAVSRTETAR